MNVSSYICFYHLKCHGVVLCVLTVHLTQWLLTDNYHTRKLIQFLLSCSQTTQPSTTTINDKSDWFLLKLFPKKRNLISLLHLDIFEALLTEALKLIPHYWNSTLELETNVHLLTLTKPIHLILPLNTDSNIDQALTLLTGPGHYLTPAARMLTLTSCISFFLHFISDILFLVFHFSILTKTLAFSFLFTLLVCKTSSFILWVVLDFAQFHFQKNS